MTREKTLTRVLDFLFESSLYPAKNAKRLESVSDESLTRPNTKSQVEEEREKKQVRNSELWQRDLLINNRCAVYVDRWRWDTDGRNNVGDGSAIEKH
jgi:hypothetical protein